MIDGAMEGDLTLMLISRKSAVATNWCLLSPRLFL